MFAKFCGFVGTRKGRNVQPVTIPSKTLTEWRQLCDECLRERKEVGSRWALTDGLGLVAFELALAIQYQLDECLSGMLQCHGNPYELSQVDVYCFPALDLGGHLITELNASGVWTRGEVYAGGRHLGTYANGIGGTTYLAQADWLGTERTRVLPSGDLFETCVSLPFGDGLNCTGSADPSPDHFTGKERDSETGLDYFGARYYSNTMGRWVSADWSATPASVPYADLGNPQTLNL